jgi:hypothetical protein
MAQRLSSLLIEPKANASQTLPSEHSPEQENFLSFRNQKTKHQSHHHQVHSTLDNPIYRNICQHRPYHKQNRFLDLMNRLLHQ